MGPQLWLHNNKQTHFDSIWVCDSRIGSFQIKSKNLLAMAGGTQMTDFVKYLTLLT